MAGIGKRMPVVMGAFTIAAAGMAGIPLLAGFVSKYYMLIGGVQMGGFALYLVGALLLSGILNVVYFWPVVYTAFFEAEDKHDAKPLVDFPLGGQSASTIPKTDGGREPEEADESSRDEPEVGQPDLSGEKPDLGEPAELVDGEYAVDQFPSDHLIEDEDDATGPTGNGSKDDRVTADESTLEDHADGHDDHDDHHHHGGPPATGWQHIQGRELLFGRETTWFMLGPILAAVTGAVVLGVVPYSAVFLQLIEVIVEGAGVARP